MLIDIFKYKEKVNKNELISIENLWFFLAPGNAKVLIFYQVKDVENYRNIYQYFEEVYILLNEVDTRYRSIFERIDCFDHIGKIQTDYNIKSLMFHSKALLLTENETFLQANNMFENNDAFSFILIERNRYRNGKIKRLLGKIIQPTEKACQGLKDIMSISLEPQYIGNSEVHSGPYQYGAIPRRLKRQVWEKAIYMPMTNNKSYIENIFSEITGQHVYSICKYRLTRNGSALCFIENEDRIKSILKIPLGPWAKKKCEKNYIALKRDDLFKPIKPKALEKGVLNNILFFQESFLEGKDACDSSFSASEIESFIFQALGLHNHYSDKIPNTKINDNIFDKFIGAKINSLKLICPAILTQEINYITERLRKYFIWKNFKIGLIHGDYKLANMKAVGGKISGLFDWDMSEEFFLFYDKLHLLICHLVYYKKYDFYRLLSKDIYNIINPFDKENRLIVPELICLYYINHYLMRFVEHVGQSQNNEKSRLIDLIHEFSRLI